MSRNVRHKSTATPTKSPAKTTPRANDSSSSEDDYNGVDLVTDSEEDEPDVEVAEEQAIIDSANDDEGLQNTPRPSIDDEASSWSGIESEEDYLGSNVQFFDEQYVQTDTADPFGDPFDLVGEASPTRKNVRFAMSVEKSDGSNTASDGEDYDGLYGSLFLDQNSLDPSFRRFIEGEDQNDEEPGSSDNGSYWDVEGSDEHTATRLEAEPRDRESESESEAGSSGYDTDDGETTEEEDPPPQATLAPIKSILRSPSDASSDEEEITVTRRPAFRSRGPRLGKFLHDATKPFALLDSHGKKLVMFKAKINRRFSYDYTGNRPQLEPIPELGKPIQFAPKLEISPMLSAGNLMMSAMVAPIDNLLDGGQAFGPPEAFYPWTNISANGTITQDSLSDDDEYDLSDEDDVLNVEDFLDFGDGSSDGENAIDRESDSPGTAVEPSSTPARPTTATSEDQVLGRSNTHHFDPMKVGAFRQNQSRHHLLYSNRESRESLAFSGPNGNRTIRGIKKSRLHAANTPMTPVRKQKKLVPIPMDSSPLAHLTGGAIVDKKRKFDYQDQVRGHKRTKSLM